jgi:hypothetical protein
MCSACSGDVENEDTYKPKRFTCPNCNGEWNESDLVLTYDDGKTVPYPGDCPVCAEPVKEVQS